MIRKREEIRDLISQKKKEREDAELSENKKQTHTLFAVNHVMNGL
jgi:hypothetical protein